MFITKKHISRRTILQGLGAAVALPFLDAMLPAMTPMAASSAVPKTRFVGIEMVHGSAGSTAIGRMKNYWSPARAGNGFEITPTLKALEPYRDYLTVISNTQLRNAMSLAQSEDGPMADHARSSAVFLTGAHPNRAEREELRSGPSIDQLYAQAIQGETAIPSLQLCIEDTALNGDCGFGYSCSYTHTISWASAVTPMAMTRAPREIFDRLFGADSQAGATRAFHGSRSVLDGISSASQRLRGSLSPSDRTRLSDYLDQVRTVEKRIQRIEERNAQQPRELKDAPASVPGSFDEHTEIMFDLQVLAFMADITRVSTVKLGVDRSQRIYPQSGVSTPFHTLSHHREEPEKIAEYAALNAYHVSKVAYFVAKLKESSEGAGSLLDHSIVMYGSPMGDSHVHAHNYLPLVLLGRAGGAIKGGQHLKCAEDTPMSNVLLTLLHKLGVERDRIGDSNGDLSL